MQKAKLKSKVSPILRMSNKKLNAFIDTIDIDSLTESLNSRYSLDQLTSPYIVNGVSLLTHKHRGRYFKSIIDKGFIIAVIKDQDTVVSILTEDENRNMVNSLRSFQYLFDDFILNQISGSIIKKASDTLTKSGHLYTPKKIDPDDFWMLYNDIDRDSILNSTDPEVVSLVSTLNNMNEIKLTDKTVLDIIDQFISMRITSRDILSSLQIKDKNKNK